MIAVADSIGIKLVAADCLLTGNKRLQFIRVSNVSQTFYSFIRSWK